MCMNENESGNCGILDFFPDDKMGTHPSYKYTFSNTFDVNNFLCS